MNRDVYFVNTSRDVTKFYRRGSSASATGVKKKSLEISQARGALDRVLLLMGIDLFRGIVQVYCEHLRCGELCVV